MLHKALSTANKCIAQNAANMKQVEGSVVVTAASLMSVRNHHLNTTFCVNINLW